MSIYEYAVKATEDDWRRFGEENRLFLQARRAAPAGQLRASATSRGRHQHRHHHRPLLALHSTAR
jgi:hypothetical protein